MTVQIPRGFRVAGVHCGIKSTGREDLTLFVADQNVTAAGVYTQNIVHASSVARNRQITPNDRIRVVVANSGNANTCTGQRGQRDTNEMARLAADAVGADPQQVLVMSTGIIGEYLPMDRIAAGIVSAAAKLGTDDGSLQAAARGIMTTDKFPKLAYRTVSLPAGQVQVTGMAKGAGMIGPNMATMLSVILTDAALTPADAQAALTAAVNESFNCISVEGHMSTSDTVLLLASGIATGESLAKKELASFRATLTDASIELARMIPEDGEGASHLINIEVRGCKTRDDARLIAKSIANSALVKTGIAGADPNWGRIVSAAGYCGVKFDPEHMTLSLNETIVYDQGNPVAFDHAAVSASIRGQRETFIVLELGEGDASCRYWTSDMTVDYIRLNSQYHT